MMGSGTVVNDGLNYLRDQIGTSFTYNSVGTIDALSDIDSALDSGDYDKVSFTYSTSAQQLDGTASHTGSNICSGAGATPADVNASAIWNNATKDTGTLYSEGEFASAASVGTADTLKVDWTLQFANA